MSSSFLVIPGTHTKKKKKLYSGAGTVVAQNWWDVSPYLTVFVNVNQASYWRVSVAQELKEHLTLLLLLRSRGSFVLPLSLATESFPTLQKSSETTYNL